ncbi:hypothetical protein IFR05_011968 [Cadophora sp. M221]|nr:hypothetical protein IFR05_011968 [Cadophora sp. M221]
MDLDPLAELERLANNATSLNPSLPSASEISRWVILFNYKPAEANALLIAHRADINRTQISDSHWSLVRLERKKAGYDREAYEHSLLLVDVLRSQSTVVTDKDGKRWTLYRLGGVLGGDEDVREVCGEGKELKVARGEGDGGREVEFVWVDEKGKAKVEDWIKAWGVLGSGKIGEWRASRHSEVKTYGVLGCCSTEPGYETGMKPFEPWCEYRLTTNGKLQSKAAASNYQSLIALLRHLHGLNYSFSSLTSYDCSQLTAIQAYQTRSEIPVSHDSSRMQAHNHQHLNRHLRMQVSFIEQASSSHAAPTLGSNMFFSIILSAQVDCRGFK